jgi:hypothetical protein
MNHLPIAILLALCAMYTVALAQTNACDVSLAVKTGSCSAGRAICERQKVNETTCSKFDDNIDYWGRVDCTAKTLSIYTAAGCNDAAVNVIANNNCTTISGAGVSIAVSFDQPCSSAASLASWVSYFLL